jgi:hypothetical protein
MAGGGGPRGPFAPDVLTGVRDKCLTGASQLEPGKRMVQHFDLFTSASAMGVEIRPKGIGS